MTIVRYMDSHTDGCVSTPTESTHPALHHGGGWPRSMAGIGTTIQKHKKMLYVISRILEGGFICLGIYKALQHDHASRLHTAKETHGEEGGAWAKAQNSAHTYTERKRRMDTLRTFCVFGLIPLTLLSGLRHIFLHGTIIQDASPFFEAEAGGANLGITIALCMCTLYHSSIHTYSCLLTAYLVYMIIAMISSFVYVSVWKGLYFVPFIGVLLYFVHMGFEGVN